MLRTAVVLNQKCVNNNFVFDVQIRHRKEIIKSLKRPNYRVGNRHFMDIFVSA